MSSKRPRVFVLYCSVTKTKLSTYWLSWPHHPPEWRHTASHSIRWDGKVNGSRGRGRHRTKWTTNIKINGRDFSTTKQPGRHNNAKNGGPLPRGRNMMMTTTTTTTTSSLLVKTYIIQCNYEQSGLSQVSLSKT